MGKVFLYRFLNPPFYLLGMYRQEIMFFGGLLSPEQYREVPWFMICSESSPSCFGDFRLGVVNALLLISFELSNLNCLLFVFDFRWLVAVPKNIGCGLGIRMFLPSSPWPLKIIPDCHKMVKSFDNSSLISSFYGRCPLIIP